MAAFAQPFPERTASQPGAAPKKARLVVERLDARALPSGYTAFTVSDLIKDINAANRAGGANTITLGAATTAPYVLAAVNNSTDGNTGLPVIAANDKLTIVGNGDAIERSTASGTPAFRLFDVAAGASLTLQKLTLQGGLATGAAVWAEGGAIYNRGTLTLSGVTVQDNFAQGTSAPPFAPAWEAAGGGIYSNSVLTLEDGTVVQNNQALGGIGGAGIDTDSVSGYRADTGGAGGEALGGGICVAGGTATLNDTTLSSNTAQGGRGGDGYFSLTSSPKGIGGDGGNGFGGGLEVSAGTVSIASSILSSNTALGGQAGHTWVGTLLGVGGNGFGGGLEVSSGRVKLSSDALSSDVAQGGLGNGAPNGGPGEPGVGYGGGLYIASGATVDIDPFTLKHFMDDTASTSDPDIFGTYIET